MKRLLTGLLLMFSIDSFAQEAIKTVTLVITSPLENGVEFKTANGTSGVLTCIHIGLSSGSCTLNYNLINNTFTQAASIRGISGKWLLDSSKNASEATPMKIIIKNDVIVEILNEQ